MHFVVNNWYLFVALFGVLFMLVGAPLRQAMLGIASIPSSQAVQLINRQSGIVVDVREAEEFKSGHIPRALNLPLSGLATRLNELQKFKDKPVILCCRSGQRSARAAVMLRKNGFNQVHNLSGGLLAWQKENLPTEA